jgi:hypothetical protein
MNINQLFGLEAKGAVVVNGKGIYENVSSLTGSYYGLSNVKIIDFVYKVSNDDSNCLKGKEYKIVIVLTEDIMR